MPLDTPQLTEWINHLDFNSGCLLGRSNQGEVRRFRWGSIDLAIKTPKGRGLSWRFRQLTLMREYQAFRRMAGLRGVPECHGLFNDRFLVLEFVEGVAFRQASLANREGFFAGLLETIEAMHERGVAHGDLKRKDNLLVDNKGNAVVLDFGAATIRKAGFHPFNQRLFKFMCQTDLNAWIKLKYGGYEGISESDLSRLKRSGLERTLTRLRRRS